jgi:ABC-type dipeptide/oligopeptide/nickel transport system permease component
MSSFLASRLLHGMFVVLGVVFAVSLMIHLIPGDPVKALAGDSPMPKAQMEIIRHSMGLDRPLIVQLASQMARLLRGDLGRSFRSNVPVIQDLRGAIPSTLSLAVAAMVIAVAAGVVAGAVAAVHRGRWLDSVVTALAVIGVSMPTFWIGILLIFLLSVHLRWLPTSGEGSLQTLIMPAITLGWYPAGALARLIRSEVLEVLQQEYVSVARAKGLGEQAVLLRHVLRNALIPTLTLTMVQFGILLSGAVVAETVFGRNGLGRFLVEGILHKDFPVVQGAVLVIAMIYTTTTLLTDLLYAYVDPRVRYE